VSAPSTYASARLGGRVPTAAPSVKPTGGSVLAGLVASACCGGSLLFASIGLGAFYSSLQMYRYIPQALGLGTVCIVAINYAYHYRRAKRSLAQDPGCACGNFKRAMMLSSFIGLVAMAASFIFLTWLEHGVVKAGQFLTRPEYGQALIPGVPNQSLLYVVLTFLGLLLLLALPFPRTNVPSRVGGGVAAS
jgi:hypothetical protein